MKKNEALKLLILFGLISLFGDIVYEAARSINGQYLQILGANAALVGLIVGFGEFFGYGLRLLSGYFSDKSRAYWFFTIFGYALLVSIPLLALAGIWQIAAFLIISERIGKAIRTPARDTLISNAAKTLGTGIGFGIHEFLDQIGALLGPLLITFFFLINAGGSKNVVEYKNAYNLLWLPFIALMIILFVAFFLYRNLQKDEKISAEDREDKTPNKLPKIFFYYLVFTFMTTIGFISFAIFGYHFKIKNVLSDAEIPFFYGIAMIIDALTAISIGKFYDFLKEKRKNEKAGLLTLIFIPITTLLVPFFIFSENISFIFLGVFLWGIALGAHETIMRAAIADISSMGIRGTAYGIFTTIYGIATFLSGAIIGFLYDLSFPFLLIFVVITQLSAFIIFLIMKGTMD
ncbi:MAG: MFS transporter [Candidatus Altiarchaeota archaeon]